MQLGIDLGGTKTEIIALDSKSGIELYRHRVSTPAQSYEAIIRQIIELVRAAEHMLGERGSVGIGIPGAISPATGLIKNANTVCLIGRPLKTDLSQALARPVRLANDANCFALSEATDGAAAGDDVVFGVILGTGVGGGVVVHGQVLAGANSIAGEWGHNPLPWPRDDERPGPACYCGKHGCIETFLSGPAMRRAFTRLTGRDLSPAEIVAEAEHSGGDDGRGVRGGGAGAHMGGGEDGGGAGANIDADEFLVDYEVRLARALASVINILDPNTIVLGGGLSNIQRFYENVPRLWSQYVFSDRVDTKLVPAKYGDSSGVRGAAWLWPR
jgi:predicted NBD/HSP70 family sugar kinase